MQLFICHSGRDRKYVERIASVLEAAGIPCWYYERDNHGENVGPAVDAALDSSSHMLFVMSRNLSSISTFIANELSDSVRSGRKVIPLRVMMPPDWFPDGSRSYVSSFPDINDASGSFDHQIVEEIRRIVFRGAGKKSRLQRALDEARIVYTIDGDGDFHTEWTFVHERSKFLTFVDLASETSWISGRECRIVTGYFPWNGDRDAIVEVLQASEIHWKLRENPYGGHWMGCSFCIRPDASGMELRKVCQEIAGILQKTIIAILERESGDNGWLGNLGSALGIGVAALMGLGAAAAISSDDE